MQLEFAKRRRGLMLKIRAFRRVQRAYMPDVRTYMTHSQRPKWDDEGSREAEAVRLFLPSDIADERGRKAACAVGLREVEVVVARFKVQHFAEPEREVQFWVQRLGISVERV
ncbi:hypothetical protein C8J57DRAFT_1629134 [Mycena rebaudengoi]|nr:hypothetical protein C8J57DRAFT_1629134 [Mycena rebaudengoi]